jgi:hypothetical protein
VGPALRNTRIIHDVITGNNMVKFPQDVHRLPSEAWLGPGHRLGSPDARLLIPVLTRYARP